MEKVRFSIIENDLEWNCEKNFTEDDDDDKKSSSTISSERSADAILGDSVHSDVFHGNHREYHGIWNPKEIENTLKKFDNSEKIYNLITWGNFDEFISGSHDVNVALLLSAWYNSLENVQSLLNNYLADVNFSDPNGRTALHFACCISKPQIVKILLDHGADPNRWDKEKLVTPLHCAAGSGSVDCITLLLKRKAFINAGIEKRSALHWAVDGNAIDCVENLLKYGADPNTPQVFTETPLHTASALGYKECVKLLLEYGADVRSQFGKRRLTALHLAAEDDYLDCVRLLLDRGAQIDARNADNQTPLHLACLSQCLETLELLIKSGANVNAIYKDGRTALHAAIVKQSKCFECVEMLLAAGAEVNRADNYGYTPLHISALNEFSNCVYSLIEHGADVTARTNGGVSALSFIVRRTPDIIPKMLAKFDASIKVNDHEIGDVDCEIKLDFRVLVPCKDRGESELLLAFIEVGQKRILTHPLCETFLHLKWKRIRKFFIMSLIYHALYVLMFTLYILGVYVKHCEDDVCLAADYVTPVGYFVVILNLALLGKEVFQMCHGLSGYARYWENWLQWTIFFVVFLCVTPEALVSDNLLTVPKWQHHVAGVAIFLVWLELMMLVGRFPIFGLYVQMFTKVAVNFSKFLLAYCCLLIAFGLSFCVLFTNYEPFQSIPWGLMKTVIMMSGELEFEDIFYNNTEEVLYPVTTHILFLAFVILVTVILTNLLVGLAVSDIQGLQVSAGLDRLIRQAELVFRIESLFFSRILRKAPPRLIAFCQRSALLRTSQYQLQFITRPNDPRDTRLPEHLKVNIYKLVAERRDRNQSIRRKKREDNLSMFRSFESRATQHQQDEENDGVQLRSNPISALRNRFLSENDNNINKRKLYATMNEVRDERKYVDNEISRRIEAQISGLEKKFDQFAEKCLKRTLILGEEMARIKMRLDQPY